MALEHDTKQHDLLKARSEARMARDSLRLAATMALSHNRELSKGIHDLADKTQHVIDNLTKLLGQDDMAGTLP